MRNGQTYPQVLGVFDGHGGEEVAEKVANIFADKLPGLLENPLKAEATLRSVEKYFPLMSLKPATTVPGDQYFLAAEIYMVNHLIGIDENTGNPIFQLALFGNRGAFLDKRTYSRARSEREVEYLSTAPLTLEFKYSMSVADFLKSVDELKRNPRFNQQKKQALQSTVEQLEIVYPELFAQKAKPVSAEKVNPVSAQDSNPIRRAIGQFFNPDGFNKK
jgi:hypothetical protein